VREYGTPGVVLVPGSASLADVVFRRAREEPSAVMLRRRDGSARWLDVTAARFCAEVSALARGLIAAGIGPGDRVGLMSRTRYEWTQIDYAIWAAGGVTVPVYETSSARHRVAEAPSRPHCRRWQATVTAVVRRDRVSRSKAARWPSALFSCSRHAPLRPQYSVNFDHSLTPVAVQSRRTSRTNDGQTIKGLTAATGNQALDLLLLS